jgi:hypothetical protein
MSQVWLQLGEWLNDAITLIEVSLSARVDL